MAVRDIINCLDPTLRKPSAPVERVDDDLRRLIDDMFETMYEAPGIGLAAIQLGIARQVIIADVAGEEEEPSPLALINPQILWKSPETSIYSEGCLSLPEQFAEVERPARCRVAYIDTEGEKREIETDGLMSTCLQHEIDHLDGVLFVDHLSKLKRDMIIRKIAKAEREKALV